MALQAEPFLPCFASYKFVVEFIHPCTTYGGLSSVSDLTFFLFLPTTKTFLKAEKFLYKITCRIEVFIV